MKSKKILGVLLSSVLALGILATGCGKSDEPAATKASQKQTLTVWTFSEELKGMVDDYYLKDNPNLPYEIDVVIVPDDAYQAKLDPALQAGGKDAPDVFALESQYAKKYTNSDLTMTFDDLGISEDTYSDSVDYVLDVARDDNGKLKGAAWQACPGAFFYRRSIAQECLGVSEPDEVQEYLKDFDTFLDTARTINEKSGGNCKILPGVRDIDYVYFANRNEGWIVDNQLTIDPLIDDYFAIAKTLYDEDLVFGITPWEEGWFAAISDSKVFGYSLPTWGLHYVLKTNAENADSGESTSGDWGMVQGPGAYFNGGTWLTVNSKTEMKEEAKALVEYLTANEDFLKTWALDTGDFLANKKVVNEIKDDFKEEFLNGQNHYAIFADLVEGINADHLTGSDGFIQDTLVEEIDAYGKGEKDKDKAIADFKMNVKNAYPDLMVD